MMGDDVLKNILLICTGNTCRSSMAEGILKQLLKNENISVKSAGTSVFVSEPANNKAIHVMREMGVDISQHISQPVTEKLISESDIVLTMTENHKVRILSMFPEAENKIYTLKEYASKDEITNNKKDMIDLENLVDYKKNEYLDAHLDEIHSLIEQKKELNSQIKIIDDKLDKYKYLLKEYIRNDVQKLSTLEEYSSDISDPYGKDLSEYRKTADEIKKSLVKIISKIEGNNHEE